MPGPLSHIRVLDLTRVLAGPWCTQMLADLGADVIKIERPGVGDETRQWGPPWLRDGEGRETPDSTYFSSTNRNKRSITVDISKPDGQALIRELAASCDVLAENYKVGDLARYGLDYESIRAVNSRIVYCSITGYGQDGPYAQRAGYDLVFQGEGGLMSINGERDDRPGGGPMKVAIAVTDVLAGLHAAIAIIAALEHRSQCGIGQHIDLALLDSIVNFGSNQIVGYFATGKIPRRWGNTHPNLAPYQVFATADGHMIVGCGNQTQWRRFCEVIERADLVEDPRFRDMPGRNVNRESLVAELERTLTLRPTSEWLERLSGADIPNGPISDYRDVFEHPQVRHRGLRVEQQRADGTRTPTVANPIRFSDTPVEYRRAPPALGEDTVAILGELLGKTRSQIDDLARRGVI